MSFQIHGLPRAPFQPLFALDDAMLAARGARRVTALTAPGYPCRISLRDAAEGERLILLNYSHLSAVTPYAARHAIYVREAAEEAALAPGDVPDVLTRRLLSVRGFDDGLMIEDAAVVQGTALALVLQRFLATPAIRFVDVHNAGRGCFAARVTRAGDDLADLQIGAVVH